MSSALVWFRRDLRAVDHAALHHALRFADRVHCAFVFDRAILDALTDRHDRRVAFIRASLHELDAGLDALARAAGGAGSGLIVRHGAADEVIPRLACELGADKVFTNRDYEPAAIVRDSRVAERLAAAGIEYGGWLPNYLVPQVFASFKVTVHIPRRPYLEALPGIPTIRPFEAMACGIPLVSARWNDAGGLFTAGQDFLVARDGGEMTRHLASLVADGARRRTLSECGRATIMARHT